MGLLNSSFSHAYCHPIRMAGQLSALPESLSSGADINAFRPGRVRLSAVSYMDHGRRLTTCQNAADLRILKRPPALPAKASARVDQGQQTSKRIDGRQGSRRPQSGDERKGFEPDRGVREAASHANRRAQREQRTVPRRDTGEQIQALGGE